MKTQNFEKALPEGYKQKLHINAKDIKLGIIFNLIALAVLAVVMALAIIPLFSVPRSSFSLDSIESLVLFAVLFVAIILYTVLHELVHGIAYKALTGEKLTFGLSWSCAFCGVPNIFTYRKTALVAVSSPLILFTVILSAITAILYFVHPLYYLVSALIFGLHLGGCSGDIYVIYLILVKFKGKKLLMRDTGPEQFFYVYE